MLAALAASAKLPEVQAKPYKQNKTKNPAITRGLRPF
jgi:hypothetical protein